jgi:hypothetical protein
VRRSSEEQIRAPYAHLERTVQQLQNERDAKITDLKSGLAMINKFMELEERFLGKLPSPGPAPSPLLALADLFMRKLNEASQMSRQELVDLAVAKVFSPMPSMPVRAFTQCS